VGVRRAADVVTVARLLGEPARAEMLDVLLDGLPHPANELARRAGVASSTASEHLSRLLAAGLVVADQRGRERLYRLGSPAVAEALEALARVSAPQPITSLRAGTQAEALRLARTCYDHLAGRVGVAVADALVVRRALVLEDESYRVTTRGELLLRRLGVDVDAARTERRAFARACLDWTERRPHLAGSLGAGLAGAFLARDWVRRRPRDRALIVTDAGREALASELAIELR
jgi:DNA-binding transcriptional ArsR family regulator